MERDYPSHTLILFTQRVPNTKHLFCYIDLFSTFQFYVLLNKDYSGNDIYLPYYQSTTKEELPDIDVRRIRPKYLNIVISEYKIDMSAYKGQSIEEMYQYIENQLKKRQFNPVQDIARYLRSVADVFSHNFLLAQDDKLPLRTPLIEFFRDMHQDQKKAFYVECQQILEGLFIKEGIYRNTFLEDDGKGELEVMSSPWECMPSEEKADDFRKAYGHLKFQQMQKFMEAAENAANEIQ
jgi:hypothetical protein